MKLSQLSAAAALLCLMGGTQAAVITFNNPGTVEIDNNTGVATYTEAGFQIQGQAADFLTLDDALQGGFENAGPITLSAVGGGLFALLSLDYAFYDLGAQAGTLTVTGLLGGQTVASLSLAIDANTGANFISFGSQWATLSAVTFSSDVGFALDNISAVPEPTSALLVGLGLAGLVSTSRRKPTLH